MANPRTLEIYRSRLIATERKARLTVDTYVREISRFLDWALREGVGLETATPSDLARFLIERAEGGLDPRSVAKSISALRSFCRHLVEEGIRKDDPATVLERPRAGRRLPAVLSRGKVDELLASVDVSGPLGIRDRALFELVYSAGLRVSEAVGLDLSDVDFAEGLACVRGKGNKERLVPFGDEAASWLRRYLSESRMILVRAGRSGALFVNSRGARLSRKGIWKNYSAVAASVGAGTKLHTLRHS
ncbi:MAG: recombinase XerD, partial [Treponema sp. RIFOXYC1_FULL_61_9]